MCAYLQSKRTDRVGLITNQQEGARSYFLYFRHDIIRSLFVFIFSYKYYSIFYAITKTKTTTKMAARILRTPVQNQNQSPPFSAMSTSSGGFSREKYSCFILREKTRTTRNPGGSGPSGAVHELVTTLRMSTSSKCSSFCARWEMRRRAGTGRRYSKWRVPIPPSGATAKVKPNKPTYD